MSPNNKFDASETFIPRIHFKKFNATATKNFTCNKQAMMAESVRINEPQNTLKHTVILSLYNTCMCYLLNRELGSPIETSKTPNVGKGDALDLDLVQLDKVTEEIFKTKNDDQAQEKINELFDGDESKPSRNIDFFLSKNHEKIGEMGRRVEEILNMKPKKVFDKWNKLSELSLKQFGNTLKVDEKNPLDLNISKQMNQLVAVQCMPERQVEKWLDTDENINALSFATCTTSIMCAQQIQQCFNRDEVDVDFYECISSDKELMKCTNNVIMKNLGPELFNF